MQKTRNRHLQVAVIGKGRLGTSLARALAKPTNSFRLHSHLPARSSSFKKLSEKGGPEVLIFVTRDNRIKEVAQNALRTTGANLRLLVHCAGSMPPDILPTAPNVMRATFHPIQTFAKPDSKLFKGVTFTISTPDRAASTILKKLAKELGGGQILELTPNTLPLYHSMIVYGANFTILLGTALEEISKAASIHEAKMKSAFKPILLQAVTNMLSPDTRKALTGPIARGDSETIERHRKALKELPPEIIRLYDDFLKLAKRFGLWASKT